MELVFDNDIAGTALGNMINALQTPAKNQAFVRALLAPLQDCENVFSQLYTQLWLANAVGAQLDGFGTIVGLARQGLNDQEYQAALYGQIAENNSKGQFNDIVAVFSLITGSTSVQITEAWPASLGVTGNNNINGLSPAQILGILQSTVSAGVRVYGISFLTDPADTFSFFEDVTGKGFDDLNNPGNGGTFASLAVVVPGP